MAASLESLRQQGRNMAFSHVDFNNAQHIAAFVEGRYDKRAEHRLGLERQWYTNIAQYLGYQYHEWDESAGRLRPTKTQPWRVRLVCNRLMPIVRKVVSKILRQRPTWNVIPATNDTDDISKARIGNKVLQYYWRYLELDDLLIKTFTWMSTTGNVFLRAIWDPNQGPELATDPMEFMNFTPDQTRIAERGLFLGDVAVEMCTPFEIDVDSEATCMKDIRYLIHTKATDIEHLVDVYGSKARGIEANFKGEDSLSRFYEKKLSTLQGSGTFQGTKSPEDENTQVLCHSFWVNPSRRLPQGKYCVVAGGKILHTSDLPNRFKRIPYVHMQEITVAGRFWGTSALEQCIPLQASYNRRRSQLIENANLLGRPKVLLPKNSGVLNTAIDSRPGEIIEHNYGAKPEFVTPPAMPEYIMRLLEYDLKDMEDVSAIHEVTQARAPSGVRSGVAINQLQEQDDQMLAPTFLTAEKALSKIGSWILQLIAENVTEPRLIKIVGKEDQVDALEFLGSDLLGKNQGKPGVNYFDVETQIGSQLPLSSAARKDFVLSLIQSGVFNPQDQADRKKIFQVLELGTEEAAISDDHLDRQNARKENYALAQGDIFEPRPFDNDDIHIEEHRRFQKAPEYTQTVSPEGDQAFEAHIQGHELKRQMSIMETQMPPGPIGQGGGQVMPIPQAQQEEIPEELFAQ